MNLICCYLLLVIIYKLIIIAYFFYFRFLELKVLQTTYYKLVLHLESRVEKWLHVRYTGKVSGYATNGNEVVSSHFSKIGMHSNCIATKNYFPLPRVHKCTELNILCEVSYISYMYHFFIDFNLIV